MPNAIIYRRVSTQGQAEDGLGLEAQLEICHKIAEQHGFTVPEDMEIVEQASGAYLEREGLDRARSIVRSRRAQGLICSDLDRLSRDEIGTVILLSEARDSGVVIYTRSGPTDTTREGNLLSYVKQYGAAIDRDKIRQRTMDGKRVRPGGGFSQLGAALAFMDTTTSPTSRLTSWLVLRNSCKPGR